MAGLSIPRAARRRLRTPTVLQMEAVECGAAALAIILGHYGRIVPLEELRVLCGVSRDGAKASSILAAARHFGLEAGGRKAELGEVPALPLPVVVYWNFNHFLVLEGFGKDRAYLNDPASGPRHVSLEEFDQGYTGIVLTFKPTGQFRRGGARPSLIAALGRRLGQVRGGLALAALAGLGLVLLRLVLPTLTQVYIDKVLMAGMTGWFRPLLLGLGSIALLQATLGWLQSWTLNRLNIKLSVVTTSTFFWHLLRLPVDFYTQRYAGEIGGRVLMNAKVADFLAGRLVANLIDGVLVGAYAILMFAYAPGLALVALAALVLQAAAALLVNRVRVDGNRTLLQERGKADGVMMGGLANIETLKATGAESDLFARWAGYQAKYVTAGQAIGKASQMLLVVPPLLSALASAAVLVLGARRVMQGSLSVGQLVAFQALLSGFLAPVGNLVNLAGDLQTMEGVMNRLDDVADNPLDPALAEAPAGTAPALLEGRVELRGVSFGYSPLAPPLIQELDLCLEPGARVALVGATGCGKSTVAKLVTGLYRPTAGQVLLDGRPREAWPRAVVTASLAMVDQDVMIFEGTVRDNLTLWNPAVPESVLLQACEDACILEDLAGRAGGLDAYLQEGGGNLSGGQRQRLELARALAAEPRILVLDEATSALDTATERRIELNLRRRGCTCIVIAHRLSTVRDADEIIVLEQGRVLERGRHEQLLARGGAYARLATAV